MDLASFLRAVPPLEAASEAERAALRRDIHNLRNQVGALELELAQMKRYGRALSHVCMQAGAEAFRSGWYVLTIIRWRGLEGGGGVRERLQGLASQPRFERALGKRPVAA